MKIHYTILVILCILFPNFLLSQTDISGLWKSRSEKGEGIVEIIKDETKLYQGKFIKAFDPTQQEKMRKLIERKGVDVLYVLENFKGKGKDSWEGGTVFSPARDRKFTGKLDLINPDQLKVTAYWGFLKKSFVWDRIKE